MFPLSFRPLRGGPRRRTRSALLGAAFAVTLAPSALEAQAVSVGVAGGLSAARYVDTAPSWPEDLVSSRRFGPAAALTATLALPADLELRVEVGYVEKGATGAEGEWSRLAYLETPILVRYRVPLDRFGVRLPTRPFVGVGIAPAREIGCSGESRPPPHAPEGERALEPVDCTTVRSYRGDLGLVAGAGIAFEVGGVQATAELRHTRGMSDLIRHLDHRERHNRSVAALVGAAVPLPWWGG